jgi:hypothetical protein
MHPRCRGIDIHKESVVACLRLQEGRRAKSEVRRFGTTTAESLRLHEWLSHAACTHVAMESTSVYWKPVFNLLEGSFGVVLANAYHIKAVPGRKTDVKDCEWIANLLAHGLIRASFIPPAPIRNLRDLTRHRKSLIRDRVGQWNRWDSGLTPWAHNVRLFLRAPEPPGHAGPLEPVHFPGTHLVPELWRYADFSGLIPLSRTGVRLLPDSRRLGSKCLGERQRVYWYKSCELSPEGCRVDSGHMLCRRGSNLRTDDDPARTQCERNHRRSMGKMLLTITNPENELAVVIHALGTSLQGSRQNRGKPCRLLPANIPGRGSIVATTCRLCTSASRIGQSGSFRRSCRRLRARLLGESGIQHLGLATLGYEDVGRLDVAMDDALDGAPGRELIAAILRQEKGLG